MPGDRRPRRVLMTADTVGGVWDYSLELARGLARHGVSVTLATMGRLPSPDQRRDAARIPSLTVIGSTFRLEWTADAWDDVAQAGEWLQSLAASMAPDVVHLNKQNLEDGLDLLRALDRCGLPSVCTIHLTQTARYLRGKLSWL